MKIRVLALAALLLLVSCSGGEEAAIQAAIHNCFSACQRGDLEMALKYTNASEPSSSQIQGEKRDVWLAGLSAKAKESLDGATLSIDSLAINEKHAFATVSITTPGKTGKSTIRLSKFGDGWLLEELPLLNLETASE